MKRRYFWITGISIVLVIIIVVVTGMIHNSQQTTAATSTHTAPGIATSTSSPIPASQLETFKIVPSKTTASYSVFENLIFQNKPNNDAIGTTNSVQGNFGIKKGSAPAVSAMNITVDLRTLKSDSDRRDHYIQQNSLETSTYPTATFVSTDTQGLPTTYTDGQTIKFQLVGNMTMHGKTNKETFDVQGTVSGDTITGTATSTIFMTDFGIQPPNLANIAISQNKVVITLKFIAQQG